MFSDNIFVAIDLFTLILFGDDSYKRYENISTAVLSISTRYNLQANDNLDVHTNTTPVVFQRIKNNLERGAMIGHYQSSGRDIYTANWS